MIIYNCTYCKIKVVNPRNVYFELNFDSTIKHYLCFYCYAKTVLDNTELTKSINICECGNKSAPIGRGHSHWCNRFRKEF